jgi:nucleotide-binding universal stress UspA family protein
MLFGPEQQADKPCLLGKGRSMAIRKLLLPLQTTATAAAALTTGLITARLWQAHLAVLHVAAARGRETDIRATFDRLVAEHAVPVTPAGPDAPHATASFRAAYGREAETVAYEARLADLTVVPHPASREDVSSSDALHAVLFDSGQPVLIAPQAAPQGIGSRICLGWNGSAESASAVLAALPWLQQAEAVRILWSEEYQRRGPTARELEDYLVAHDIVSDRMMFQSIDNIVGAGLLAAAGEFGADLLVMGAYSHSRLRQAILGGVTRYVLEHATVPLMMHR